jgi:dGTP triphosphohydrolase
VRYLRDLPRESREREARTYRSDPRFARLLADHLAAMTDTYALAEHARLLEMGAVPIPSLEQIRREDAP